MTTETSAMFKKLFTPFKIGNCEIPNRIAVPAMVTNMPTEDGYATEQFIKYYEEKAKGGYGLIITEDYLINPNGKGYKHIAALYDDDQIEGHAKMVEAVHSHGSKIFCQIYHCGRQSNHFVNGGVQTMAPSPSADPWNRDMARELSVDEIHTFVRQFGEAAGRAKKCGFDGIEIHAGHGYLIAAFLSFHQNHRTDEYGGPLVNRVRFLHEVYDEMRKNVGDDFPIMIRFSAVEGTANGRDLGESRVLAKMFEEWGVDAINCSNGLYSSYNDGIIASTWKKPAFGAENAKALKEIVNIPVMAVNRINDPLIAEELLQDGFCDFVGMGRGSLADPHLPNKAKEGRLCDIRQCIGCLQACAGHTYQQIPTCCLVNPEVGKEYKYTFEPTEQKKVLIIGGGPGGMNAAIAAARRGHDVTLWEKEDRLGGQFIAAGCTPGKGDYITYVYSLDRTVRQLGVKVELNKEATADDVRAFGADKVIIATGGVGRVPTEIPGIEGDARVIMAEDILRGRVNPEGYIYVLGGGSVGIETACYLADAERGHISIVIRRDVVADKEDSGKVNFMRAFCEQRHVKFLFKHTINELAEDGLVLTHNGATETHKVDWVVLSCGYVPVNGLVEELKDLGDRVVVVGDAVKCRDAEDAGNEGFDAGYNA